MLACGRTLFSVFEIGGKYNIEHWSELRDFLGHVKYTNALSFKQCHRSFPCLTEERSRIIRQEVSTAQVFMTENISESGFEKGQKRKTERSLMSFTL